MTVVIQVLIHPFPPSACVPHLDFRTETKVKDSLHVELSEGNGVSEVRTKA